MKRSSSERAGENPWTEIQQEPAKKAKSEDVPLIIIEDAGIVELPLPPNPTGENGHQNGNGNLEHQNGNSATGDAVDGIGHLPKENGENGHSSGDSPGLTLKDAENGMDPIFEDDANGPSTIEIAGGSQNQTEEAGKAETLETEDEENMELKLDEDQPTESQDEQVPEPAGEPAVNLPWGPGAISLREMIGHTLKVNAVDIKDNILVSGSDDTTVRAWDLVNKKEICSLNCKKAVSAVLVLDRETSREIVDSGNVVISGAKDGSAKIWEIPSGNLMKSFDLSSGITCIAYIPSDALLIFGTEKGQLELVDTKSGKTLSSVLAFACPVISLKAAAGKIFCGDLHGCLQTWSAKDKKLNLYRTSNAIENTRRNLSSLALCDTNNIIVGMQSGSVKKMNWINGSVSKLRAGAGDSVDALGVTDDLIIVTTSNEEKSYLHFYNLASGSYLGSARGKNKMTALAAAMFQDYLVVACGGEDLDLWVCGGPDLSEIGFEMVATCQLPQPEILEETDSEDDGEEDDAKTDSSSVFGRCSIM
ncbi:uncharacterized protein LOC132196679 [Neocloeon triangulifer]|uniref:uncharacterized protein LOC132196679 n=1 Tax=Neocloeon triangulifer TaxID=2078957 RepID=UPI00286F31EA|nr:uncharacterized protein LOC132196679 [Neocloeon triangulifer]